MMQLHDVIHRGLLQAGDRCRVDPPVMIAGMHVQPAVAVDFCCHLYYCAMIRRFACMFV